MDSYGQHAPSSSLQQDSALVAQFDLHDHAGRDRRSLAPSDTHEEADAWNDTIPDESRLEKPAIGWSVHKPESHASTNERAPLLPRPSISRINGTCKGGDDGSDHDFDYRRAFFDEVKTLARYTLPVFGYASQKRLISSRFLYTSTEAIFWRCCRSFTSRCLF